MDLKSKCSNHDFVFILLSILAFLSIGTTFLSLSPGLNNWCVFGIAAIMASLVLLQYMDLKSEGFLVIAFFIVPVVLFAILVVLTGLASPNGPRIF